MKTLSMALALSLFPVLAACGTSPQEAKKSGGASDKQSQSSDDKASADEGKIVADGGKTTKKPAESNDAQSATSGNKEPDTAPQAPSSRELDANDPVGTETGLDLGKSGRLAAINGTEILIVDSEADVDDGLGLVALDGSRLAKIQEARTIIQGLRAAKNDGSLTAEKLLDGCKAIIQLNLCESFPNLPVCRDSTSLTREMTVAEKFKLTVTRKDGVASCSVSPLGAALTESTVKGPFGYTYTYWPTAYGTLVRGPAGNYGFIKK